MIIKADKYQQTKIIKHGNIIKKQMSETTIKKFKNKQKQSRNNSSCRTTYSTLAADSADLFFRSLASKCKRPKCKVAEFVRALTRSCRSKELFDTTQKSVD